MKKKTLVDYWVDIGLVITFLLTFLTGLIKWPGLVKLLGENYLKLPLRAFTLIHDWSGLLMGVLVIIHIITHWKWIVRMTKTIFKRTRT